MMFQSAEQALTARVFGIAIRRAQGQNGSRPGMGQTALSSETVIATKAGTKAVPTAALLQTLGVDGLIRLHGQDFDAFAALDDRFVTFNLAQTTNEAGKRYAIVPIVTPGSRDAVGREVLPVIDPCRARAARCLRVRQGVGLDEVTPEEFAFSLPHVRTPEQLGLALVKRYGAVNPCLTPDQMRDQGCAVTTLRLGG